MDTVKEGDREDTHMSNNSDNGSNNNGNDYDSLKCLELGKYKGIRDLISYAYHNLDSTTWLNRSQIVQNSNTSDTEAQRHIGTLVELGVFDVRGENNNITRYKPNPDSMVLAAIVQLELAIRTADKRNNNNNE